MRNHRPEFEYLGEIYPVDFIDWVNNTVGFRKFNGKMELEGVFVKEDEGKLIWPTTTN